MTTAAVCPLKNCNLSIDVILTSSDGIYFGGHIQNLKLFSEGFCGIGQPQDAVVEPVSAQYQETADVLRILLQFMHSEVPPDLRELPFSQLKGVAEAVNKYIVYHAIPYCNVLLQQRIYENSLTVFEYSLKYNDRPLQELASKGSLHLSAAEVYKRLEFSRGFLAWAEQRKDARTQVIRILQRPPVREHKGGYVCCDKWFVFFTALLQDVLETFAIVDKTCLDNAIQRQKRLLGGCHYCGMAVDNWNTSINPAPLSDFVVSSEIEDNQVQEALAREKRYDRVAVALLIPPRVLHKGGIERCEGWAEFYSNFALKVMDANPMEMTDIDPLIRSCNGPIKECRHCTMILQQWNLVYEDD